MSFDDYKNEVTTKVNEWLNTLSSGRIKEADDLKEAAGDMIAGWKENYPRRKEQILDIVDGVQEDFWKAFDNRDKK